MLWVLCCEVSGHLCTNSISEQIDAQSPILKPRHITYDNHFSVKRLQNNMNNRRRKAKANHRSPGEKVNGANIIWFSQKS